jgi:hypothetical protein
VCPPNYLYFNINNLHPPPPKWYFKNKLINHNSSFECLKQARVHFQKAILYLVNIDIDSSVLYSNPNIQRGKN